MKKIISLALAIIMIMMIGVVAFADKTVHFVELKPVEKEPTELIDIEENEFDTDEKEKVFYSTCDGGTYYLVVRDEFDSELKKVNVESNNTFVEAEVVDFDCKKMTFDGIHYGVKYKKDFIVDLHTDDYDEAVELAKEDSKIKKLTYKVVAIDYVNDELVEVKPALIKLVVDKNYGTSFKEAEIKVTATRTVDKKEERLTAEFTVVTDVVFFRHDEVEYAADRIPLVVGDEGYSAYDEITPMTPASVVAKTSFRAIEGQSLKVENGDNGILDWVVTIPAVAKGQHSVNFTPITVKGLDFKKTTEAIKFGFYATQPIESDFTIDFHFNMTYKELLTAFHIELEEEDKIDYFVYKDGKVLDKITVDYDDQDIWGEDVEFTVKCNAFDTLGVYEIKTVGVDKAEEVPADGTEVNPDTGAPVVVPALIAIGTLMSVALAASCVAGKRH